MGNRSCVNSISDQTRRSAEYIPANLQGAVGGIPEMAASPGELETGLDTAGNTAQRARSTQRANIPTSGAQAARHARREHRSRKPHVVAGLPSQKRSGRQGSDVQSVAVRHLEPPLRSFRAFPQSPLAPGSSVEVGSFRRDWVSGGRLGATEEVRVGRIAHVSPSICRLIAGLLARLARPE